MPFDPTNKVVQLCVKGMDAEFEGKPDQAHHLFQQAWDTATDDFEAFTAAHYLARNQKDPNDALHWNLEALHRAQSVKLDEMKTHLPSLYLNIARSYETLGDKKEAGRYYHAAADYSNGLPDGKYSDMIRSGIAEGLKRTGTSKKLNEKLARLIDRWCEKKDLRSLAMILPAYVADLGSTDDRNKIISALSYLQATRSLDADEQATVEELIIALADIKAGF